MKQGLVMEGGAMRGLFSMGVIDVLMEQGITFDGAVGVSAGAVFGCNYKSHQPGRVLRYNLRFCKEPQYCSLRSLVKTGDLYGADFCYNRIPNELDVFDVETYTRDPMPFYVVATDVETGKAVYHACEKGDAEDMDWFRASASMPLAARIVEVGGHKLLDGGVADSIPLKFMEESGYEKNLVILTQPLGYVKGKNKALPLVKAKYRDYPNLIRAMATRQDNYNAATAYVRDRERTGDVLVIRPEAPLDIGKVEHDREKIQNVYNLGRATAEKRLPAIREFLNQK